MMVILKKRSELPLEVKACFPGVEWFDVCYYFKSPYLPHTVQPAIVHP